MLEPVLSSRWLMLQMMQLEMVSTLVFNMLNVVQVGFMHIGKSSVVVIIKSKNRLICIWNALFVVHDSLYRINVGMEGIGFVAN